MMRYEARVKDPRRVGHIFQDDNFPGGPEKDAETIENWKSVMTELHERKIKVREPQCNGVRKLDSSFDSGIQQEYNSDNDEVCTSICLTLNRLVELSKEQRIYLSCTESFGHHLDRQAESIRPVQFDLNKHDNSINSSCKSIDSLSMKSSASEAYNSVEEVIMKNSAAAAPAPAPTTDSTAEENHLQLTYTTNLHGRHQTALGGTASNRVDSPTNVLPLLYDSNSTKNSSIGPGSVHDTTCSSSSTSNRMYVKNQSTKSKAGPCKSLADCDSRIVVAIDIGTTYSGYAFAIDDLSPSSIRIMKNIRDYEVKKVPSILLLNSCTELHSFGYESLEYILNYDRSAEMMHSQWLLFDKFKFQLLNTTEINREYKIKAVNGIIVPALLIYTRVLTYFKYLVLQELTDILQSHVKIDRLHWIVTIPVMWSTSGKLFMQEAAFNAGLCGADAASRLTVMYECEAAASWCNISYRNSSSSDPLTLNLGSPYFLVINCGGGTLDATVHLSIGENRCITSEIHKAEEVINNSLIVNEEFIRFLVSIFGKKFMHLVHLEKPMCLLDLIYQWEGCKCKTTSDIYLRPCLVEFYETVIGKKFNHCIENVINEENVNRGHNKNVICLETKSVQALFRPLAQKIIQFVERIIRGREERKIARVYFTGGLVKSPLLQRELQKHFETVIPVSFLQKDGDVSVLKGMIYKHGVDNLKFSKMNHSYAIGVIKEFKDGVHPIDKLVLKEGRRWCCDFLDWLVHKDQILYEGEVILKRYTPTTSYQSCIVINIYAVEDDYAQFVTDNGVHIYGVLRLSTSPCNLITQHEILLQLIFTGNDFLINALDTLTNCCDQLHLDNLSYL